MTPHDSTQSRDGIPNSSIAGFNELTIGVATTVLGACLTYFAAIHLVMKDPPSA